MKQKKSPITIKPKMKEKKSMTEKERRINALTDRQSLYIKSQPKLKKLYELILSHGGDIVVPVEEDDIQVLLDRGEVFSAKKTIMKKGIPCQCHYNSANLWDKNKKTLDIVTGYALSHDEDGLKVWRSHTWAVLKETGQVVETTVKRKLYFGVKLTIKESEKFYRQNGY